MLTKKLNLVLFVFLPYVASLSIIEEFYITRQLLAFFGEIFDDESNESNLIGNEEKKSASLLSQLDIKERPDHYWTRLGHRSRTTAPPYNFDYFYYSNPSSNNNNNNNNFYLGRRKRRNAKFNARDRQKRDAEVEGNMLAKEKQNETSDPKPNFDSRLQRNFNKCCADPEETTSTVNENLHQIKADCRKEIRKNRKTYSNNSTFDGNSGLYNLFSCDRLNNWKATITCTINCMAQKLEMIDTLGAIDVNRTKSVILQNFAFPNWQQEMSDALVEKCIQDVSHKPNAFLDKYGLQCNTQMAEFAYCMWREFFISCPAVQQTKTKHCEKLRYILRKNQQEKFSPE